MRDRDLARYPSAYGDGLKTAAAEYLGCGLTPAHIVTGCGSDSLLDTAFRALAQPGARVAFHAPTFVLVPAQARLSHLEPVAVPFAADWGIDPQALLGTRADVIYLCAPNNPTGCGIARADLETVVAGAAGYVIVDEAYAEYAGESAVDLVAEHPRVIVTRTLSKAFGLADLRVGYAAAAPPVVAALEAARGPFRISSASLAAACAALTADREWMRTHAAIARETRDRFVREVAAMGGWETLPSRANFVLLRAQDAGHARVASLVERLERRGVAGRYFSGLPGVGDALRITVGPWPMLEPVIEELAR